MTSSWANTGSSADIEHKPGPNCGSGAALFPLVRGGVELQFLSLRAAIDIDLGIVREVIPGEAARLARLCLFVWFRSVGVIPCSTHSLICCALK